MTTVNISLPSDMYKDVKKTIKERGYSSVSELVRDALRRMVYPGLTENGFTPEFEDAVLEAAQEPVDESKTIETDKDLEQYFRELHKRVKQRRHDKD